MLSTTIRYLRHVPYCHIFLDGESVAITDDWNIETAIISETIKSRLGHYELHWGAAPSEGSFVASNWGFLIGENIDPVLPFFTPTWITGEIYFLPGVVDLNVARDAIVANDKAHRLKQEIRGHLRRFIHKIASETEEVEKRDQQQASASGSRQVRLLRRLEESPTSKRVSVRHKLADVCMIYNHCMRNPQAYSVPSNEEFPLSLEETNHLILDLIRFQYGLENRFLPLRKIIDELSDLKISKAYYKYSYYSGFLPVMAKLLSSKGFLVFEVSRLKVLFRGAKKGAIEANNTDILRPILKEYGIELQDIQQVPPEEIVALRVGLDSLPRRVVSLLREELNPDTKLILINLQDAEVVFQREKRKYLNTSHPVFQEFIKWSNTVTDKEIKLFLTGLLQETPKI